MTVRSNGRRGTILVTDAGRGCAIAVIRSLGRRGWRVIAADADPRSLGFRSRYADDHVIYPSPETSGAAFSDVLYRTVRNENVDLVIPVTDQTMHLVVRDRQRLERCCRLAIAETDAVRIVTDKAATVQLAQRLQIPTPETRVVRTPDEAREAATELGWPVVLKSAVTAHADPVTGRIERRPVSYANSSAQLEARMRSYNGDRVLLQEYCRGTGHGVEMLADGGRLIAAFQHRRLAEIPVTGGASAWRESVPLDPAMFEHATRLVDALGWTGLIMVEFKVGRTARFMEINGRVWGSMPLAVFSGMDFPAQLAELLLGDAPAAADSPLSMYQVGVQAINLELIVLWMASVLAGRRRYAFLPHPRRRDAVAAAVGMLGARCRFDILSHDDLRPGLGEFSRIARKLAGKVREFWRSNSRGEE